MGVYLIAIVMNTFVSGSGVYSKHFVRYSELHNFDPLFVVAVAYIESKIEPSRISRTNDYGLMQLHVSHKTNAKYLGREHLLFKPKRNIRIGVKMLSWWRNYHERKCKGSDHHWLLHYNQGQRVYKRGWHSGYSDRVLEIYQKLLQIKWDVLRGRDATS